MGINQIKKAHSYGERMKLELRVNNLQQEAFQMKQLMGQLDDIDEKYGAHRVTGIVYSKEILEGRLKAIEDDITATEKELS